MNAGRLASGRGSALGEHRCNPAVEIVHRDGSPKHQFLFERGLTKVAARLSEAVREMAGKPGS